MHVRYIKTMHSSSYIYFVVCLALLSAGNTTVLQSHNINWSTITAAQLHNLSASAFQDITQNQVASIPPEACKGFKANQIAATPPNAFQLLTQNQLENIPAAAFSGFLTQLQYVSTNTLEVMNSAQLLNLGPTLGYIPGFDLARLFNSLGLVTANAFLMRPADAYPLANAVAFKVNVDFFRYSIRMAWLSNHLEKAEWLQLAILESNPAPNFNSTFMTLLNPSAMIGLRSDQVKIMDPSLFSLLSPLQATYLASDAASNITSDQLAQIPAYVFGYLSPNAVSGLNPYILINISGAQASVMTVPQILAMSCCQLYKLYMPQTNAFQPAVLKAYFQAGRKCPSSPC